MKKKKTKTHYGLTKYQHTKLRGILNKIVRKRDKKCLKCGNIGLLHASHIYPKGRCPSMQYDPENVKALCPSCHLWWWHKHPIEASKWVQGAVDKKRLKKLHKDSLSTLKARFYYKDVKDYLTKYLENL